MTKPDNYCAYSKISVKGTKSKAFNNTISSQSTFFVDPHKSFMAPWSLEQLSYAKGPYKSKIFYRKNYKKVKRKHTLFPSL